MADDVPVTDILCEAMEYLSKLGANLRTRSENLKEKKIRKDRLKNSHAVQKAAQKVLTICELSKKSLENVETGVKRILSVVNAAQATTSDGGKSIRRIQSRPTHGKSEKDSLENRKKDEDLSSPKTIHLSGKNYTLRFPKKVNVKHYKSVKVLARSLPMSMIIKYQVYYNCKLFRARERRTSKKTNTNSIRIADNDDPSSKVSQTDTKENVAESKEAVIHNDSKNKPLLATKDINKEENKSKIDNVNEQEHGSKKFTHETIDLDSSEESKSSQKDKYGEKRQQKKSDSRKNRVDEVVESTMIQKKSKKVKHRRIIIDSSESEEEITNKIQSENENINESSKVIELQSVNAVLIGCNKELLQETHRGDSEEKSSVEISKEKVCSSLDDSSKDSCNVESKKENSIEELPKQETSNKCLKDTSNNESLKENLHDDKTSDNEPLKSSIQEDIEADSTDKVEESDPVKPLIKCVSISKLLKPDVLVKEVSSNKIFVHMDKKGQLITKYLEGELGVRDVKTYGRKIVDDMEQEYKAARIKEQAEKRRQVAAFKPKNFTINVTKLPKLSVDYLYKNKLKRITQNSSIICEISDDHSQVENEKHEDDASQLHSVDVECTKNAKHALLYDSDEDNSESSPTNTEANSKIDDINETEKIKNALLNDSDSDQNEEGIENINKTSKDCNSNPLQNNPKESLHVENDLSIQAAEETPQNMQENTKTPERLLENDDQDKELAKSLLLNDSSGSSTKSPSKKKTKDGSGSKARRKHIMESIHAKKMLLTSSSSSDTEEEKNSKDTLIKNIESENENTKSVKKKLLSSSDSDDDVIKQVKKKRKISKSRSASPKVGAVVADSNGENGKDDKENSGNNDETDSAGEHSKSSSSKMGRSKEKPGGSGSQKSDSQDDKDIEGLTNLNSLSKHRRRRGSDSDKAESTSTRGSASNKTENMSNSKHITGEEGLLEAPVSSDEASQESDGAEEDLPPISLPGLNGDGLVEHLAKDDLLEESDSDNSKGKVSDDKKENDSDSDALKSKRRKGNTISSDSEAGSSRRKNKDVKMSDFEDSEDDNSEPIKRTKRKISGSDSDASAGSSSDGGKKKRRRIKQIDSDVSGSDSENEGRNKHGRKNIRKVMGKNQLEEATKKAARQEKERLARIIERQKMYNNLEFDESGKPDEVIVDKVVLDFDPETKEPLIEVDRGLVKKLKPHQANGIKFMWDACFESVKRIKKDRGSGCILAHCMGLGKTLQVVSLTHTLLIHSDLTKVNRVLVVCPLSTVLNWVNEFKMWLKHAHSDYEVDVYELSKYKQNSERAFQLSSWFSHGGVCVLGYEMFRNLSADNPKKFKKKMLRQFQESLVDPGPDMVVCDEGHLLKNEKTSLSQSMNRVRTQRRIVLTGTPLQNNLKEYYCMVQFVKPNLLGKYNEYLNRFVNPITNGQYTDSTDADIKVMKRRSHVLHKMLDGAVQRRDYGVLAPFLPPKHEYVLFITLTDVQVKLYQHYLDNYSRRPLPGKSSGFLFPDFQSLQRIWTHPLVLKYNSERYEIMQQKKREREEEEDSEGSLVDFIDDDSTPDETSTDEESDSLSDVSDDSRKKSKKKKSSKKSKTKEGKGGHRRGTRANPAELVEPEPEPELLEAKNENPTEWWIPLVADDEIDDMRNSHKLVLLFEILRQCEAIGDKLLVFSQSLYSLDLIEYFLGKVDEATQEARIDEKLGNHVGSWSPGIDYFRLDGSTSCENRSIWCKNFNREDNPRARLFLISTRAGGLGINLVAANRVVIFDVSWNPSHDVQSIFRVYRFGQKKPCYVYRFLAMGTMEEKIYERQVTKQAISKRVIDEQQIDRHYAENDLAELYKFEPRPPEPRPVPLVPKDRLFAEMIKEREAVIYKFHEHDSLLENKEEETLSEEERKAAWEDFENEKNRPPPQPFPSWPNGMAMGMPGLLAQQQQQQLAYAALASMLRKDMPNLTDDNIRAMLPLIYSSNPGMFGGYDYGLMQKLSSMYAQPSMMNPAMMNPGMNVGAQPGLGGGTSGLQYEPPWQRQQQQQQQMRLQQLMQQQNQMGAKFYAGGLGSRDPVAMALQQQRAREIMLGGGGGGGVGAGAGGGGAGLGAGRPRGRPPLQPRAPPAAPGDVVNLDSD